MSQKSPTYTISPKENYSSPIEHLYVSALVSYYRPDTRSIKRRGRPRKAKGKRLLMLAVLNQVPAKGSLFLKSPVASNHHVMQPSFQGCSGVTIG
ncbi:hypothetical protein CDAR_185461 [Caerostris darwini]|uniref:Uncharacterized protein n=1 Tax=Caerostris darwini TaxID=1538125 RepID=A0AAV4QNU5_9ARAC|nr:hypothetical protein CDAR_185461 [Caerostris darwini]